MTGAAPLATRRPVLLKRRHHEAPSGLPASLAPVFVTKRPKTPSRCLSRWISLLPKPSTNGERLLQDLRPAAGHGMCALIGYRRGPGGQHRQATSRTRARRSRRSSSTSCSSSACACCTRVDRGWKSRSSTSLPRCTVRCWPLAEWHEDNA